MSKRPDKIIKTSVQDLRKVIKEGLLSEAPKKPRKGVRMDDFLGGVFDSGKRVEDMTNVDIEDITKKDVEPVGGMGYKEIADTMTGEHIDPVTKEVVKNNPEWIWSALNTNSAVRQNTFISLQKICLIMRLDKAQQKRFITKSLAKFYDKITKETSHIPSPPGRGEEWQRSPRYEKLSYDLLLLQNKRELLKKQYAKIGTDSKLGDLESEMAALDAKIEELQDDIKADQFEFEQEVLSNEKNVYGPAPTRKEQEKILNMYQEYMYDYFFQDFAKIVFRLAIAFTPYDSPLTGNGTRATYGPIHHLRDAVKALDDNKITQWFDIVMKRIDGIPSSAIPELNNYKLVDDYAQKAAANRIK